MTHSQSLQHNKVGRYAVTFSFSLLASCGSIRDSLEKFVWASIPVIPSAHTVYAVSSDLPGPEFFPMELTKDNLQMSAEGVVELQPGDYTLAVNTFCMKSSAGSPAGHRYTLARLEGAMSDILHTLHLKSYCRNGVRTTQYMSWSIQNGVKLEAMPPDHQRILAELLPEQRDRLRTSFWELIESRWGDIRRIVPGLPSIKSLEAEALEKLGPIGKLILELRRSHDRLVRAGHDFAEIERDINRMSVSIVSSDGVTVWSRLDKHVYGRFVTSSGYNHVGTLQLRVLESASKLERGTAKVDIARLVADPGKDGIQPLALVPAFCK